MAWCKCDASRFGEKGHFQALAFINVWCLILMFTLQWCLWVKSLQTSHAELPSCYVTLRVRVR